MPENPEVTILIPTRFDSRPQLDLCLRTIRKYTELPYRIIVGDGGIDDDTSGFLRSQEDVLVVKCPEPLRAKDTLARAADTPFFLFQHDDTMILRPGWLKRRLDIMKSDSDVAVIGVKSPCFVGGIRRWIELSPLDRRFLPLCMMVRKEAQDELDLLWGIYNPFDTGSIAYQQIRKHARWKFYPCKFNMDVKHWGRLAWILKKSDVEGRADGDRLKAERDAKLKLIHQLLESGDY